MTAVTFKKISSDSTEKPIEKPATGSTTFDKLSHGIRASANLLERRQERADRNERGERRLYDWEPLRGEENWDFEAKPVQFDFEPKPIQWNFEANPIEFDFDAPINEPQSYPTRLSHVVQNVALRALAEQREFESRLQVLFSGRVA